MSDIPPGYSLDEPDLPPGYKLDPVPQPPAHYDWSEVPGKALESVKKAVTEDAPAIGKAIVNDPTLPAKATVAAGREALDTIRSLLTMGAYYPIKAVAPEFADKEFQQSELEPAKRVGRYFWNLTDPENLKRELAERPLSTTQNILAGASGIEPALAKIPSLIGKSAALASGKLTGVQAAPLIQAYTAARRAIASGDPELGAANEGLIAGMRGRIDPTEVVERAQSMMDLWHQKVSQAYRTAKDSGWGNDPTHLDFQPIRDAWNDLNKTFYTKDGKHLSIDPAKYAEIKKIEPILDEWENDPAARTPESLDALKKRISSLSNPKTVDPQVDRAVSAMADRVRSTIYDQAPDYKEAMANYAQGERSLGQLRKTLSSPQKGGSVDAAYSKLLSAMREDVTARFGSRGRAVERLEQETGKPLQPYLAGPALHPWFARGMAGAGETGLGALGLFHILSNPNEWMHTLPAMAGVATAMSPRVAGEVSSKLGLLHGAAERGARWTGVPQAMGYALDPRIQSALYGPAMIVDQMAQQGRARGGYLRSGR